MGRFSDLKNIEGRKIRLLVHNCTNTNLNFFFGGGGGL